MDEVIQGPSPRPPKKKKPRPGSGMRAISIRGRARSTISRTSIWKFRATSSWSSPACPAPANHRSPSIPSMPRASGATRIALGLCAPVPGDDAEADVDQIDGLSPAISIEQKTTSKKPALDGRTSPRSTTTCACYGARGRRTLFRRRRLADRESDRLADGRSRNWRSPRHTAFTCCAGGARAARANTAKNSPNTSEGFQRVKDRRTFYELAKRRFSTRNSRMTSTWWWTAIVVAGRHRPAARGKF